MLSWEEFRKVDIRSGTIVEVQVFPEARHPAYKVWVDLGPDLGIKKSSAQITHLYDPGGLIGKQVLCVVNFPPRQIGPFLSEILITGLPDKEGNVVLATVEQEIPNGSRLF